MADALHAPAPIAAVPPRRLPRGGTREAAKETSPLWKIGGIVPPTSESIAEQANIEISPDGAEGTPAPETDGARRPAMEMAAPAGRFRQRPDGEVAPKVAVAARTRAKNTRRQAGAQRDSDACA